MATQDQRHELAAAVRRGSAITDTHPDTIPLALVPVVAALPALAAWSAVRPTPAIVALAIVLVLVGLVDRWRRRRSGLRHLRRTHQALRVVVTLVVISSMMIASAQSTADNWVTWAAVSAAFVAGALVAVRGFTAVRRQRAELR